MKRFAFLFACLGGLLAAAPLSAIIGGQIDGTAHPYVGSHDSRPTGRRLGSGVLVAPTVYVTAGHGTKFFEDAGLTRARVTFDPVFSDSATFYEGTVYTHPDFAGRLGDPNDLGVIVFDEPIPGITPAELPPEGLLDELGPQGLHDQIFTTVGYGIQRVLGRAAGGGQPRPDRDSMGTRKFVHESFLEFGPSTLRLLMHEDGQTCTGDSGAPSLFEGTNLVAGLSVGGDAACGNMDEHIRLDTPSARAFLGQFVELP